MSFTTCFCFSLIIISTYSVHQSEVDYYVRLIQREIRRSSTYQLPHDASQHKPQGTGVTGIGTWDYIVVGAGAAGSVIANRLSEDNRVLVIEAGGRESNFSDIPRMSNYLQQLQFNWNYRTTPQTTCCLGLNNRQCLIPRGKGIGGSTIINTLKYARGNKRDFNSWCAHGNRGWCYNDLLPLFRKSENVRFPADLNYHGTCGNLYNELLHPGHPELDAFVKANQYLGRSLVDFNARTQLGVGIIQFNTINGKRQSTGKAFLTPVLGRKNLVVLIDSYVTKVLINQNSKIAHGVQFTHNGSTYQAKVSKEVILSAGAIGSPQLLMLSGIGPSDHLQELGIPVIENLPVGNNFQDHPGYLNLYFSTNYTEPVVSLEDSVRQYLNGVGPLTYAANSHGLSFVQSQFNNISGYPDIEIVLNPSNLSRTNGKEIFNWKREVADALWSQVHDRTSFGIYVILLHEKSRGTLRLKSKNPYDYPLIDVNFFSDPHNEDIERLYQGIQSALQLIDTPAFKRINASLIHNPLPECRSKRYLSRDFWHCQIRQIAFPYYHPIGTCSMGVSRDPNVGAVVDPELKVYGIKNLRVADTSIIPSTTSGHTSSAGILIGEKLAQIIKSKS